MKILINAVCAKKYAGGGFQIALNFVRMALKDTDKSVEWYFIISDHIAEVLKLENSFNIFIFPAQPDSRKTYWSVAKQIRIIEETVKPDVVYSILAPSYFFIKSKEVMRVTDPWVAHPNKYAQNTLSAKGKIRNLLYIPFQKYLIRKGKFFITQTDFTADCIARIANVPRQNVKVVNNVLPAIYNELDNSPIEDKQWINITSVAAPFPHKNLDIIPEVLHQLNDRFGISNVKFHVTIPEESSVWNIIRQKLKAYSLADKVVNHGRMSQTELSILYRSSQMMFLPTLLEVFSASILEAMYFDLKIVASDFPFNSTVIGDAGLYFQPTNAIDAAEKIAEIIKNEDLQKVLSDKMKKRLSVYRDYEKHFNCTKEFLIKVGKNLVSC